MSAGRVTQTLEEMLPLFPTAIDINTLRVWGGEGERDADDDADTDDDDADADDDDNDDDDSDDNDSDDDDDDDDDADKDKAKGKKKSNSPSLEDQLDEERRKNQRLQNQINKDKKAKDDAKADKDAAKDRDKYKAKLEARDKFLTENLLSLEIQKQTKHQFVDVDDVVSLIQRRFADEVVIDLDSDTPGVTGLDLALKRIAKDKPHWLKSNKKDDDDDDSDGQPSGGKPGGGKVETDAERDKRLMEKYKIPGSAGHLAQARPL